MGFFSQLGDHDQFYGDIRGLNPRLEQFAIKNGPFTLLIYLFVVGDCP